MMERTPFAELMRQVRAGNEQAAEELVKQYEPQIRRRIRMQMNGSSVQRFLDSGDIFQSVAINFFVKATAGDFELNHPAQLAALLMTMAHNKLLDKIRHEKRMVIAGDLSLVAAQVVAEDDTPSRQVALKDLFQQVMARLSPDERALADQRFAEGLGWAEIQASQKTETNKEALRKRLERGLSRVLEEMGHGGVDRA
jgi:RNA polymerase sigma factor (sigma-70 family)